MQHIEDHGISHQTEESKFKAGLTRMRRPASLYSKQL